MTTESVQDRRGFARDKLEVISGQSGPDRIATLREIETNVLSFSSGIDTPIAVESPSLPNTATVIGKLQDESGQDFTAIRFDLSEGNKTGRINPRVTNAQIQAANSVVQQYAQEERNPLLIFTLPDDSGIQFAIGNLSPTNPSRLDDIVRVSAYRRSGNRTALECLDRIGNAIVSGDVPERAFRLGFNVQPVTDEFFREYEATYDAAVALIAGCMDQADAEQFTQILLNRLLFVHLVYKKGWLRFNGDSDYINALWRDYQADDNQSNFYNGRLTTLFFAGLNNPQSLNLVRDNPEVYALIGDVPFLNGGLFDQTDLDKRPGIIIPDDAMVPLMTGLFNNYNFTVTDATALDTEVAVDPEMLGKLFEETVNERHSNGAYYAPRPVVSFMCRKALKGYIANRKMSGLAQEGIAELWTQGIPRPSHRSRP